jgi:hypothetical protein
MAIARKLARLQERSGDRHPLFLYLTSLDLTLRDRAPLAPIPPFRSLNFY